MIVISFYNFVHAATHIAVCGILRSSSRHS